MKQSWSESGIKQGQPLCIYILLMLKEYNSMQNGETLETDVFNDVMTLQTRSPGIKGSTAHMAIRLWPDSLH